MDEVSIALLGNSYAARVQLPALDLVGGNRVLGVCGQDPDKIRATQRQWSLPHATTDYRELLDLRPDLVIVSTPVDLHAAMVRDALDAGAAVLCEKPFAMDASEAEDLCRSARGRLALIDHQLRWNPYRRQIAAWLDEGVLGEVWHARTTATMGAPARLSEGPYTWWYDEARGGGMLGAIGSHLVDGLMALLGDVSRVDARLATYVRERRDGDGRLHRVTADEHASLWLELESGVRASVDAAIVVPEGAGLTLELWGSRASVHLAGEEELTLCVHGEAPRRVELEPGLPRHGVEALDGYGPFGRLEPLFLRDVLAAVRAGETELPGAADFEAGRRVMEVLDAARRSARRPGEAVSAP